MKWTVKAAKVQSTTVEKRKIGILFKFKICAELLFYDNSNLPKGIFASFADIIFYLM